MTSFRFVLYCCLWVIVGGCYHEAEIPVRADFSVNAPVGYTVPATLEIVNKTTGADFYSWTFEGAAPASSDKKQPGSIVYQQAGTYKIRLEAWNDTQRLLKEIEITLDSAVTLDFEVDVQTNAFVPATAVITNHTRGASSYQWTFAGGEPASSTVEDPGPVRFDTPGDHVITLTVQNGRESFTSSRTITLSPALAVDFSIEPVFEDLDYEAPLTANLLNQTISGLRYTWTTTGGNISDDHTQNSTIHFTTAGTYTVRLTADNDKEVKYVEKQIVVKPNSNLYTIQDVRLGVNAAHSTIGAFFSLADRRVLTRDAIDASNGATVDLVFFGINSGFTYCRFVSPDSAANFSFNAIPSASHTYFVNTQASTTLSLTDAQFESMTNDALLTPMDIRGADTGIAFFDKTEVPRIVLFETDDGRKGALRIKSFVSDGTQSYILVDLKYQKIKR